MRRITLLMILVLLMIIVIISLVYYLNVEIVLTDSSNAYYVANDGSDSNDGFSPDTPWRTIGKVNSELKDGVVNQGDDIYFNRGDTFDDAQLQIRTGGNSTDPMMIGAYGSGAKPIFNRASGSLIYCNWAVDNVTFQSLNLTENTASFAINFDNGCSISDIHFWDMESYNTGSSLILRNCDGYKIENSTFFPNNSGKHGVCIGVGASNGIIRNCTMHDCKDGVNLHFGIVESNSVGDNHLIENVTVYNTGEEPFDIVGGTYCENVYIKNCEVYNGDHSVTVGHGQSNVMIDNLYIHDMDTANCLSITKTQDVTIRNCVFQNWTSGDNGIAKSGTGATDNIIIYNNDFVSNGNSDHIQINNANVDGFIVKNNIFYSTESTSPNLFLNLISPATLSNIDSNWSYNIWWRGDGGSGDDTWWIDADGTYDFTEWSNNAEVYNDIRTDPKLTDPANGDFTIGSDSPAIDAGDWLTTTNGGGTGTTITVHEANYFCDGFGLTSGDNIFIGDDADLEVIDVDWTAETITVNRSISWSDGESVSLSSYTGSGPDIGAYEFISGG